MDEKTLLQQAKNGDQVAIQQLFMDLYDDLAAAIDRRLPAEIRAEVSADDVIQETFIEVCGRLPKWDDHGPRAFRGLVGQIAMSRLLDRRRAHRALKRGGGRPRAQLDSDAVVRLVEQFAVDSETPSLALRQSEAELACRGAFENLPDEYREVIALRSIRQLPFREVAAMMGRSEGAARMLHQRAVADLRQEMASLSLFLSRLR